MRQAVIVEALRTPNAKGKPIVGELSGLHPVTLLSKVYDGLLARSGIDPALVEQRRGDRSEKDHQDGGIEDGRVKKSSFQTNNQCGDGDCGLRM